MVHRLNISIPDELNEKLTKYKDSFNVSSVCQKAIKAEIEKIEDFNARISSEDQDMDEIVNRLKKERAEQFSNLVKIGKEDGYSWAKVAPYSDLMEAVNDKKFHGLMFLKSFYEFLAQKFSIDTEDNLESYFKLRSPEIDITAYYEIEDLYFQAATEGVQEFWQYILPYIHKNI